MARLAHAEDPKNGYGQCLIFLLEALPNWADVEGRNGSTV